MEWFWTLMTFSNLTCTTLTNVVKGTKISDSMDISFKNTYLYSMMVVVSLMFTQNISCKIMNLITRGKYLKPLSLTTIDMLELNIIVPKNAKAMHLSKKYCRLIVNHRLSKNESISYYINQPKDIVFPFS